MPLAAETNSRIPPLTQDKLREAHPEGTRHQAKIDIAMGLVGNGIPPEAVAVTLRQKFPNATDREIDGVIEWVTQHDPEPSGGNYHGNGRRSPENFLRGRYNGWAGAARQAAPASSALSTLKDWLGEVMVGEEEVIHASPVKPSANYTEDASLLCQHLYSQSDLINIVVAYTTATSADGKTRANPKGSGKILPVKKWISWFEKHGVPVMQAGAWVRPNPIASESGSGAAGAVMDKDIAAPRFLLLESDCLPLAYQLTALSVFRLPVAAILTSGGHSYHAWVKVDCDSIEQFETVAERILKAVQRFGFDVANKNPSRLSRLPGAIRKIRHGEGDGRQRLIYLDPQPSWKGIL